MKTFVSGGLFSLDHVNSFFSTVVWEMKKY